MRQACRCSDISQLVRWQWHISHGNAKWPVSIAHVRHVNGFVLQCSVDGLSAIGAAKADIPSAYYKLPAIVNVSVEVAVTAELRFLKNGEPALATR